MTVRELIQELQNYDQDKEAVAIGYSWVGCSEPESYLTSVEVWEEDGKVVLRA